MINFDFLMGGPQGVQLPDPMRAYGNALTLAELTRRQRQGVEEDAAKSEAREAQKVAAQTFANAQTMGWQAAKVILSAQGVIGGNSSQQSGNPKDINAMSRSDLMAFVQAGTAELKRIQAERDSQIIDVSDAQSD